MVMNKKLTKEIKNYLEKELRDYTENEELIKELELDIIESSPTSDPGMPGSPNRGNEQQTSKVSELMSNKMIHRLKYTVEAIKKVLKGLNETQKDFYKLYFENGYFKTKVCMDMPIGEATFHRYKNRIIYALAQELGYL